MTSSTTRPSTSATRCRAGCSACTCPLLLLFGLWQGTGPVAVVLEVAVPGARLMLARLVTGRRPQALFVASGLVAAPTALAYMSGGTVEARFHVFLAVALVGLYCDRAVLAWAFAGTAVAYLIGAALDPDDLFDHPAAQDKPLLWAAIHLAAVLAACAVVALVWHVGEAERRRTVALVGEAAQADAAAARAQAAQSSTVSDLIVHLARRNQALLDRQLELIAELEQHESTPEALADLFRLDHLATRIRRNAESLLVLSGEDPPRRWGRPVPWGRSSGRRPPRSRTTTGSRPWSTTSSTSRAGRSPTSPTCWPS